jgi:[protein-PII] uridylyltransferase
VTLALTGLQVQIGSAKISTYGHKVIDVFYVKDVFGLKIVDPAIQTRIREGLLDAIEEVGRKDLRKKPAAVEAAA